MGQMASHLKQIYISYIVYILPILLYGIEILLPSEKELKAATTFHEKTLRQSLSLPNNCSNFSKLHILSGQTALIGQIHRKTSTFFRNIIRNQDVIEFQLAAAVHQLTMKPNKRHSLNPEPVQPTKSNLPTDYSQEKRTWTFTVKRAVHS